jgi:hypothetical protein
MPLQSVIVVNTAPGCDNFIEQQISADTCNNYIVRITQNTNAIGPFDVYVDTTGSTPIYSAQTRQQMLNGVVVQIGPCVTPSPTPTPTTTPPPATPSPTPTNTPTPSITPSETPTQTPTPTSTETPTQTPTNTETPTQTPTPSATPGSTPTATETQTPTPSQTPSETPTQTPTQTTTETPTQTPTNTETPTQTPSETPTQTPTPTPSSTPSVFEISVITQDGIELINQDGSPWILQQEVTSYLVASGITGCTAGIYTLNVTLYSPSPTWENITSFYTDINFTTPFNGNNLWVTNDVGGCGMYQVGNDGFTIGGLCIPC